MRIFNSMKTGSTFVVNLTDEYRTYLKLKDDLEPNLVRAKSFTIKVYDDVNQCFSDSVYLMTDIPMNYVEDMKDDIVDHLNEFYPRKFGERFINFNKWCEEDNRCRTGNVF